MCPGLWVHINRVAFLLQQYAFQSVDEIRNHFRTKTVINARTDFFERNEPRGNEFVHVMRNRCRSKAGKRTDFLTAKWLFFQCEQDLKAAFVVKCFDLHRKTVHKIL